MVEREGDSPKASTEEKVLSCSAIGCLVVMVLGALAFAIPVIIKLWHWALK
jgi:hypothetical protein